MSAPEMTTPRAEQPGGDTEINHHQTTDVPDTVSDGQSGEHVEADARRLHDAGEPQVNRGDGKEVSDAWEAPVDGAELLDDIEHFAGRFLAFPTEHHLAVLTLWAAHTWAVSAF